MENRIEQTKVCTKCGRELPIEKFIKNSRIKSGYGSHCKECHQKYYRKNTEKKGVTCQPEIAFPPKVDDTTLRELHNLKLEDIPARLLILEMRRRGYRGKLQLVTVQDVVI